LTDLKGQTCVLAYSGGLDTSVAVAWLRETYGLEVVTVTGDLGSVADLPAIREKALRSGAKRAVVLDARDLFVRFFVWPALQADALYQGRYPLATALGRPLLAKLLVDVAREEGATYVAHGSTGKGNDQVRFDLSVAALAPDLKVIAPLRGGMNMTREEEIEYAKARGIPVPVTKRSPYSVDENLWGRSIEAGVLEDPWNAPPRDVYQWTVDPQEAPARPHEITVTFRAGIPTSIGGEESSDGVTLIEKLNVIGGKHGVGRIDQIEDRLVGIKSREIYEAPAAVILHTAHRAIEDMVLSKESLRLKERIADEYAELVYNGLWFSSHHQDLAAYVQSTQRFVSGEVRVRLDRGTATVVGRRSDNALYSMSLATYGKGDAFDHKAAEGFIQVYGLPLRNQSRRQELWSGDAALPLKLPETKRAAARPAAKRRKRA
jgi:argininosuccinate synthase